MKREQSGVPMIIESLIRPGIPETVQYQGFSYEFKINDKGHKICAVTSAYVKRMFLKMRGAYREYQEGSEHAENKQSLQSPASKRELQVPA